MSNVAIRVESLSKRFRIGARQERYQTLRDTLSDALASPFRRVKALLQGEGTGAADLHETIWALSDVSFNISHGEVVGIIGPNGAGKSTLLKIICRITEPTKGYSETRGRIGSLLEVGTGFHPELTGRENTYLYGAILGMKKVEIDDKFDEIVEFSGIQELIDTPVKHHSSGMYVRLAFAVAAHLDPEILLLDEVLAVGDMEFQKKCISKMETVAGEGRTVLFVSHNLLAVQNLCERVIWLQDGKLIEDGEPSSVISRYVQSVSSSLTEQVWDNLETAPGNDDIRMRRVCVRPERGVSDQQIHIATPFVIEVEYWNLVPDIRLHVTLHVENAYGIFLFETGSAFVQNWGKCSYPSGLFLSVCHIPGNLLNSGGFTVRVLFVKDGRHVIYSRKRSLTFDVLDSIETRGEWLGKIQGVVRPKLRWTTDRCGDLGGSGSAVMESGLSNS